jgi:hypothetical protein
MYVISKYDVENFKRKDIGKRIKKSLKKKEKKHVNESKYQSNGALAI